MASGRNYIELPVLAIYDKSQRGTKSGRQMAEEYGVSKQTIYNRIKTMDQNVKDLIWIRENAKNVNTQLVEASLDELEFCDEALQWLGHNRETFIRECFKGRYGMKIEAPEESNPFYSRIPANNFIYLEEEPPRSLWGRFKAKLRQVIGG